jgi:GNAT superfamily N-acetyltransferase
MSGGTAREGGRGGDTDSETAAAPPGASAAATIRAVTPDDLPVLLGMVAELAEYEHLEDQLVATDELYARALFGERPAAEALIAEREGEAAGYAVFFATFSTFRAIQGIWLEDLFVRPSHRKGGVGRALLAAVAAILRERGGERLEWSALDWNELALGFYRGLGARAMTQWVTHRLVGQDLERLASEAS